MRTANAAIDTINEIAEIIPHALHSLLLDKITLTEQQTADIVKPNKIATNANGANN